MADDDAQKAVLHAALQTARQNLLWKLEGLSERDLRLPRTPTGFTILGVVKHMAQVEIVYFGDTFARRWPDPDEVIGDEEIEADPQADWYATAEESAEDVLDLYARVRDFADETMRALALDAVGTVPHWPSERATVSLGQIIVHVLVDLTRHLGQVDIVREGIDGQIGMSATNPNIPAAQDWQAYTAKLTEIAERR